MSNHDGDVAAACRLLSEGHRAVLVTRRRAGGLQSSPVAAAVDDDGTILVSTRSGSAKARNIAREPRVALCALSEAWFGAWAHLDATAEIVRMPDALEQLVEYYRRVAGEHPDWQEYRQAMIDEDRVLLRMHPERAVLGG